MGFVRRLCTAACVVLLVPSAAAATRVWGVLESHEVAHALPPSWSFVQAAQPSDTVSLRFSIKTGPLVLDQSILDRSDPRSPLHGQYLSAADLQEAKNSSSAASSAASIRAWLLEHHVNVTESNNDFVKARMPVAKANQLLAADFAYYAKSGGSPVLRTMRYSLPSVLQQHVDFVYPTIHFLAFKRGRAHGKLSRRQQNLPPKNEGCDGHICPETLVSKYNINYGPPDNSSGSTLAIAGFLEEYPSTSDYDEFQSVYGLNTTTAAPYQVVSVNGGQNPNTTQDAGFEASLDVEYTSVFTGPLQITFYTTGGRPPTLNEHGNQTVPENESGNEPYLDLFNSLLQMTAPPNVISISYGDNEQTVPIKYAQKVCQQISLLTARGVSVIGSSGDGGVEGATSSDCIGPDGKPRFIPTFPASCPWLTSVGATTADGSAASLSAGGFSNYFERPDWQQAAVDQYIQELNGEHQGFYNASGRGFPDVAVLGEDYIIVGQGQITLVSGTSASAPVFAAMVTLLNDLRLRAGKPVLGFLNPQLYSATVAEAFTDVTQGSNNGCEGGSVNESGFPALSGWDAVTGLGEPDFAKLRSLLV